jgi:hypothetical protein
MAMPLLFPPKHFFYPIGNTSATCLTRDLDPESDVRLLLLGSGDARNVLCTIHSDEPFCVSYSSALEISSLFCPVNRVLDFTMVDFDPGVLGAVLLPIYLDGKLTNNGVLARNVIIFTLILDKAPFDIIWNILYHVYLDDRSHQSLVMQCKKLVDCSEDISSWSRSSYGECLHMCSIHTLNELRRHWSLYANFSGLPSQKMREYQRAFQTSRIRVAQSVTYGISAGPLMMDALGTCNEHFMQYSRTGVTGDSSNPSSTMMNPTFVYSLTGDTTPPHYGIDPLLSFHHAPLFGRAGDPPSTADLLHAAKTEFQSWGESTQRALVRKQSLVRFLLGEALATCFAIQSGCSLSSEKVIGPWKTHPLELDVSAVGADSVPRSFDVISTSNLVDHLGLLNIMTACVPLLSGNSSVMYTECLLPFETGVDMALFYSIHNAAMSVLFGLYPVTYIAGFSSKCSNFGLKTSHRTTTWKSLPGISGHPSATTTVVGKFDPSQLAGIFHKIYGTIFHGAEARSDNVIFATPESFAKLLVTVKRRLGIHSKAVWAQVMEGFSSRVTELSTNVREEENWNKGSEGPCLHDLWAQLHLHDLYTHPSIKRDSPLIGHLSHWTTAPILVRLFVTVPSQIIWSLKDAVQGLGALTLYCALKNHSHRHIFWSIRGCFGDVSTFKEDEGSQDILFNLNNDDRWEDAPTAILSFALPTHILTSLGSADDAQVSLNIRETEISKFVMTKLGGELALFTARINDTNHVHLIPVRQTHGSAPESLPKPVVPTCTPEINEIGRHGDCLAQTDENTMNLTGFLCRINVSSQKAIELFRKGNNPSISQLAPCYLKLSLGDLSQTIQFPAPVLASKNRLRLARKSLYIEVRLLRKLTRRSPS